MFSVKGSDEVGKEGKGRSVLLFSGERGTMATLRGDDDSPVTISEKNRRI
jgi:hypothetical protein